MELAVDRSASEFGSRSSAACSVQALDISLPNYAAAGLPLITAVFGASDTIYVALSSPRFDGAVAVGARCS